MESTFLLRCALACAVSFAASSNAAAEGVDAGNYREVGANHLYSAYPQRIKAGKLPPLLYAVAIVETEIDEDGNVIDAVITREPAAAKEVGPWIVSLIRAASPFPRPGHRTLYRDIWLVDRSLTFQLDTLTEGQQ
jgi:hypothetical protein